MNSHRWTLAGVAVTSLAAMVALIVSRGPRLEAESPDPDPLATVLIWALALVLLVILLNLAWTFPAFRGLAYKTGDRFKTWRADRRRRRWLTDVYLTTGNAPEVEIGTRRPTYWLKYPDDFVDAPDLLPAGRYKVRWSDSTGHRGTARFRIDKWGKPLRTPLVRFRQWKRELREYSRRREEGQGRLFAIG